MTYKTNLALNNLFNFLLCHPRHFTHHFFPDFPFCLLFPNYIFLENLRYNGSSFSHIGLAFTNGQVLGRVFPFLLFVTQAALLFFRKENESIPILGGGSHWYYSSHTSRPAVIATSLSMPGHGWARAEFWLSLLCSPPCYFCKLKMNAPPRSSGLGI